MYYIGTVLLRMRPIEFWKCTPRKFNILCRMHILANSEGAEKEKQFNKKKSAPNQFKINQPESYIDQLNLF